MIPTLHKYKLIHTQQGKEELSLFIFQLFAPLLGKFAPQAAGVSKDMRCKMVNVMFLDIKKKIKES